MQRVGVQLVADGAAEYLSTLKSAADAEQAVGASASTAVRGVNALDDSTKQGAKGLSFMEQAAVGAARKLGEFAVQGAARAAQAVLDFAKDGVKAAGDFEGGMNRFAAVTGESLGESGKSLDEFKQLFISLGRDLPVSTAQVQEAAINMAKGGIEPATIAAGGLRTVLDLAAAGEVGIAEAAEIASKQLGVWVDRAADATTKAQFLGESADLLAQAANASTVDVDGLALGLSNVGGIAKVSGLTFRETVQTMALLAPGFSSAADAGTSFKTFLSRLQPTTTAASAAMADLGLLTKDGTSAFYDAQGSFIGMDKAAGLLQDSLKGLSQAEKTAKLQAIFGTDAFRAAALIAEQGSKGFEDMGSAMAKAGTASEQAAKKQQGFNVATDNMMGSLEAFQITVFSAALPALTSLVNILASGINVITDYADATIKGQTALAGIASFISTTAIPALVGLTAAITAWAIVQAVQATPAILASLPAIAAQTAAFVANAAAVLAALAPYALIALAIGGVAMAYQDFTSKVTTATQELLNSKPFWTDSAAAIEAFGNASKATQEKLTPLADAIKNERTMLEEEIESLGKRMAAGLVSDEQYAKEMETINAQANVIGIQTKMLNDQIEAENRATAASMTATTEAANLRDGTAALGAQANLTADDIKGLGDKIKAAYEKGQAAVQSYATNQSTFLAGVEQRQQEHTAKIQGLEAEKNQATTASQKQAIDTQITQANQAYHDQETAAAASYARQQAEQQQHLGQMLIDYTVAQAQLGNISKDKAAEITSALEQAYGLQQSSVASTFLKMAGSIDTFSKTSTTDVNTLIETLHTQQQQAADTQKAMDSYAKTYTSEAVSNFVDAKGDADDYIKSLESIPTRVQSEMALPGIKDREQEIRDINRGLMQLPKEVRVHIAIKDDVPKEYKPGSPTPFEIGIRGITSAIDDLARTGVILPGLTQDTSDIAAAMSKLIMRSSLPRDAENLGGDIIAGWSKGMEEAFGDLRSQVKDMSSDLQSALNDGWDIHSPSGVTEDLGGNIMLGLLNGLDNMLPDLLHAIDEITTMMGVGMGDMTDEMRKELEDEMAAIASTVGELPDLINKALGDAYTSTADFFRQQENNLQAIFDIGRDSGDTARITEDLSKKQARLADIQQGRLIVDAQERTKLEGEITDLQKQQAAAAAQQQQRLALQQQTQAAMTQATNAASAMNDPTKAAAFLKLRSQQIARIADLQQQRLEATDPQQRAMIDAQIALERKAQDAELKAFDLQKDQLGATQDLIAALNTLNDNLTISGDMPPEIMALYDLLVQLTSISGMATGGTMQGMQPYLVGERGPELVVPHQDSTIYNALDTRRAMATVLPSASGGSSYSRVTNLSVTIQGSGVTYGDVVAGVRAGLQAEGQDADVRIRTGVN